VQFGNLHRGACQHPDARFALGSDDDRFFEVPTAPERELNEMNSKS